MRRVSWNSYPTISDQNLWFSLPCFKPEALEPGAWQKGVTSCYDTYTVGVNILREMVLSPNDEEVASSKKHTQFKTRVHKAYPISDQNGRNWYPISDQKDKKNHTFWRRTYLYSLYKGLPSPPVKNPLQIISLVRDPKWSPTPNDPPNRPEHDPRWSPTPNDPQIFSHATRNDPRGIIGMEWDDG